MSKTIDRLVLERTLELITAGHCKRSAAKDSLGNHLDVAGAEATHFCAAAALVRATEEIMATKKASGQIFERLSEAYGGEEEYVHFLVEMNDGKDGKRRVIAHFKRRLREL